MAKETQTAQNSGGESVMFFVLTVNKYNVIDVNEAELPPETLDERFLWEHEAEALVARQRVGEFLHNWEAMLYVEPTEETVEEMNDRDDGWIYKIIRSREDLR